MPSTYDELLTIHLEGRADQTRQELNEWFASLNLRTRLFDNAKMNADMPEEYVMILHAKSSKMTITKKNFPIFEQICRKIQVISDPSCILLLKNPWDFDRFLDLKKMMPEAKFVFIHRNPIHVLNSQLKALHSSWSGTIPCFSRLSKAYSRIHKIPLLPSLLNDWWKACQRTDAIIYTPTAFGGYHIAEKLGVPGFSALVNAPLTPHAPVSQLLSSFYLTFGGTFNWFTHVISSQAIWLPFKRVINRWRKESLGLPPLPISGPSGRDRAGKTPFLYGYSPSIIPPAPDWHENVHVTGYWFLKHTTSWQPSKELLEFLEAGPLPVYIGFGSMVPERSASLTRLTLEALERAGQRGIIMSGWGALSSERLPRNVFNMDFATHDWLFPQMAAIVHHGGAGTTAETLRSGVPSIVVYFWTEQQYWGRKVANLGAGSPPISYGRLTSEKLARAISTVVENQSMRQRATAPAQKIRSEDGIRQAVAVVNKYLLK